MSQGHIIRGFSWTFKYVEANNRSDNDVSTAEDSLQSQENRAIQPFIGQNFLLKGDDSTVYYKFI